ncbi:hypothetical protein DFQ26_008244 [Actinomortierella ambigua]|nr:hypothetical protein DFQ26_008244 [Actinomortierella ambigua]
MRTALFENNNSEKAQLYEWSGQRSRGPFYVLPPRRDSTQHLSLAALSVSNHEDRLVLKGAESSIHFRYTATEGFSRIWSTHPHFLSMQHSLHARQANETGAENGAENTTEDTAAIVVGGIVTLVVILSLVVYCFFFRRKRNESLISKILDKYSGQSKSSPSLTPLNDDYYVRPAPISLHSPDDAEQEREDQQQIALQKMQIEGHSRPSSVVLVSSSLAIPLAPPQPYAPTHEDLPHTQGQQPPPPSPPQQQQQHQHQHQHQQQHQYQPLQQEPYSSSLYSIQSDAVSVASAGWPSSSSVQDLPVVTAAVPWGNAAGKTGATPVMMMPHYYGVATPVVMMPHYYGSSSSSSSAPDSNSDASGTLASRPVESITLYEMADKERLRHQAQSQLPSLPTGVLAAQHQHHHMESGAMDDNLPPPPPYLQKVEATLQEPSAPTGSGIGFHPAT